MTGEGGNGRAKIEGWLEMCGMCARRLAINTSRTNHSIFSDDFPVARSEQIRKHDVSPVGRRGEIGGGEGKGKGEGGG